MNDDDRTLLASAYLDGEATPSERARVEDDPATMAELERLRGVRALVADVEPAPISVRETHLAAALLAWDRLPEAERLGGSRDVTPRGVDGAAAAGAATVSAPTRLTSRRRTPSTKWLTAAAAALVVVLAGGVVLQLDSDDNDSGTTADEASTDGTEVAEALSDVAADAENAADSGLAEEQLSTGDAAGGADIDTGTGTDNVAPPADDDLVVLQTPDDLALFAADATDAPSSPDVPAATSAPVEGSDDTDGDPTMSRCFGIDILVGPAVYGDTAVLVGIDEGRDLVIAYVAGECREVARVRLP